MQTEAKKTLIGAFVVGALALGVGGVMAFGSGRLFERIEEYVIYFEGNVEGLQPGSPVLWRGVKIGEVLSLRLLFRESEAPIIEVIVGITREELMRNAGATEIPDRWSAAKTWIDRGLRAQLGTVSILTGQLKIDIVIKAETKAYLYELRSDVPELPSILSTSERVLAAIQSIPYETLASSLTEILTGVRDLVKSPELRSSFDQLNQLVESLSRVSQSFEQRLPGLMDGLERGIEQTSGTIRDAHRDLNEFAAEVKPAIQELQAFLSELRTDSSQLFKNANNTIATADGTLKKLDAEIEPTSASLRARLDEVAQLLKNMNAASAPNAPLMLETQRALQKLSRALDSITALANLLERQPEVLLKGKSGG